MMKIIKILFAITIFILSGINTYAKNQIFSGVNQPISFSKKHLAIRDKFSGVPKNLIASENQFSRPGISKDYSWSDEGNSWIHSTNTTYSYNATGELLEEIAQDANTDDYLTRNSTEYDEHGNLTAEVSYYLNDELWTISEGNKYLYTYDGNGNVKEEIDQIWGNGAWKNDSKYVFTRNQQGEPTEFMIYLWIGTDWLLTTRYTNIVWHNWQNEQKESYTTQLYNEGNWLNYSRYTYSYNGNKSVELQEVWDQNQWVFESRNTNIFTGTEEVTIFEHWTEEQWKNIEKYTKVFDSRGNITTYGYESWENEQWTPKTEYLFDMVYTDNNDLAEITYRYWEPGLAESSNILKYEYANFLYFNFPTKTPEINSLSDIRVFPNPVKDSFTIQFNENGDSNYRVDIVNLAGQVVYNSVFSELTVSVNTNWLKPGMYILNVSSSNGNVYSSKLLKE
ncbi:MAG: T9SS type A sorting domain-containing protein [Prolixibacteraceae bacterium]|jgi:hypothetical protein